MTWLDGKNTVRRAPVRAYPHERARCAGCGVEMPYEINSIAWECVAEDRCPSCWGKKAGEAAVAAVRQAFNQQPPAPESTERGDRGGR